MALDASIPLSVQPLNIPGIMGAAQQYKTGQKRNQLLDLSIQQEQAAMPAQAAEQQNTVDIQRLKSTVLGAEGLRQFVDAGDLKGGLAYLQGRKQTLDSKKIDSSDTDRAIAAVQDALQTGDPTKVKAGLDQARAVGEKFGILGKPPQTVLPYGARIVGEGGQTIASNDRAPGDAGNLPGSLQELQAINADRALRGEPPMKPEEYLSQRRGSSADSQLYAQYVQGLPPGRQPLPMDQFLRQFRGDVAGATKTAEEGAVTAALPGQVAARTQAERYSTQIDEGYKAADSLPVLNRSIELLDSVKTGGLAAAQLAFTNFLGITGADEGQLSANVGKAVLAQLRTTFGAQFTQAEGERLQNIEAGFGKSTAVNRRLLGQAKILVERVANRGINAAEQTQNQHDAEGIRKAMTFSVDEQGASTPAQQASAPTATGPNGQKLVLKNGQWVQLNAGP